MPLTRLRCRGAWSGRAAHRQINVAAWGDLDHMLMESDDQKLLMASDAGTVSSAPLTIWWRVTVQVRLCHLTGKCPCYAAGGD